MSQYYQLTTTVGTSAWTEHTLKIVLILLPFNGHLRGLPFSRLQKIPGPQKHFPGPCRNQQCLNIAAAAVTVVTNHIYGMIAPSILENTFITVTCCAEIAKKLFENLLQLCTHLRAPSTSLHSKFQDFPGPSSFSRTFQRAWQPHNKILYSARNQKPCR